MAETFNGAECVHGHGTLRYAKNRHCVGCSTIRMQQKRENSPRAVESRRVAECIKNATELERAYFAGFFDGEGSVGIKRTSKKRKVHGPYVTVSQVRPDVLTKFRSIFGGSLSFRSRAAKNGIWCWQASGAAHCLLVLESLIPYMIVKKAESQAVVDTFQFKVHSRKAGLPENVVSFREEMMERIKAMR